MMSATELRAGDRFDYAFEGEPSLWVTVLRNHEWQTDRFGRPVLAFWCRREDTGAEGYVTFGPEGVVRERLEVAR